MFNEEQTTLIQEAMWFFRYNQSMSREDWKKWDKIESSINDILDPGTLFIGHI